MKKRISSAWVALFLAFPFCSYAGKPMPAISARFGNPQCASNAALKEYVTIQNGLKELRASNASQDKIQRYELALSLLTEGLIDDARSLGMVVVARFDQQPKLSIPSLEIEGKTYPYAKISLSEVGTQLKFEFTILGICAFANPDSGQIGDAEILDAVNSMVQ